MDRDELDPLVGPVEFGVRTTFTEWGILEPTTAWEMMAINLAQILDGTNKTFKLDESPKYGKDDKVAVASINRELRLTLEKIEQTPRQTASDHEQLENKW
jgi:hypothetical protein